MRTAVSLLLSTLLLCAPSHVASSPEERARAVAAALASGDADQILAALDEHLAPAALAQRDSDSRRQLAERLAADFAGIEIAEIDVRPDRVELGARKPDGTRLRLSLRIDREADHKISSLGVEIGGDAGARNGPELPPLELAGLDRAEIAERLESFFERAAADLDFSGTALVAVSGEVLYETARGLASRRYNVPNTLDTRFDLGSINKSFTRVAIGQLLAAGKLSLDDPIAAHLSDYPNPEVAREVTIQHLLDHTSGLGDIFGRRFLESSKALYTTPRSFFPLFAERPLEFEPGTSKRYSNAGFMVLGAIVEAVTGEPFDRYITEHVFRPAGMTTAGFFRMDEPIPNVAIGYTTQDIDGSNPEGHYRSVHYLLSVKGSPAGSAFATCRDLLAFDQALRAKRLLPEGYTRWYFDGTVGPEPERFAGSAYAYGIAGGAPGVSAVMETDGRTVVIVLSNGDEPGAERIGQAIFRSLRSAR